MSETPTGTDRVELTEDEHELLASALLHKVDHIQTKARLVQDAVESIVAARVQALTAELEAERYEWRQMRAARDATRAELAAANTTILTIERAQAKVEDRADALRAELAAANARIRELEAGIAKLRDGMHEFMRGNWPESPTPVEVYSALAALTPEGTDKRPSVLDRVLSLHRANSPTYGARPAGKTADDAWQEWVTTNPTESALVILGTPAEHAAFMAGYRRALKDAADAWNRGQWSRHYAIPKQSAPVVEKWLRDRAAGVGTKDGDDDE